ncbi:MAG: HNH endonuclease [archaeon]|nr:HNH endonuclease [archaeon]
MTSQQKKKRLRKCKKCDSIDIYKIGFCHEHFKEYTREYRRKNIEKWRKYDRDRYKKGIRYKCKNCGEEFERTSRYKGKGFCSRSCNYKYLIKKEIRKGENNPAYRNGMYVNGGYSVSETGKKHLAECRKFRTKFLKENDYIYCENCGVSNSFRFEVHHIVFASEAPKHKELHNHKNMIMLCIRCHNDFHSKKREIRKDIVLERNLEKLFNKKLT